VEADLESHSVEEIEEAAMGMGFTLTMLFVAGAIAFHFVVKMKERRWHAERIARWEAFQSQASRARRKT
jgi:hypothetical protein